MTELSPAGWYRNPQTPNQERRWTGTAWTNEVRTLPGVAVGQQTVPATPPTNVTSKLAAAGTSAPSAQKPRNRAIALVRKHPILFGVAVLALLAIGSALPHKSTTEAPSAKPTASETAATEKFTNAQIVSAIKDRYGSCLADLKVQGELVFTPEQSNVYPDRLGFALVTAPGHVITFNVALGNSGALLTVPADAETNAALSSVGC